MPCKWMHDPKIGKWWYPQCIGGIYGREGCTCPRGPQKDRIAELEKRIEKMEREWAKRSGTFALGQGAKV